MSGGHLGVRLAVSASSQRAASTIAPCPVSIEPIDGWRACCEDASTTRRFLRLTSCAKTLGRSVRVCGLPRADSDHRRGNGTCHCPLANTNALHVGVYRWMYMCVCIHPCTPFECQTDGSSNLAPGGAAQTQVGLWTPSSHHRPSTSSLGVSCPAAREAVGRRCAHRSRVVVCRCQWVRRDGVSSCRFRGPGGGGSDTKRGDAGQGFRHAGVGSAAAWA